MKDNKHTDKGWAAMKKLLDQEMPVKNRRRIFAWWWLWLIGLPVVAYSGWAWLQYAGESDKPTTPVITPRIEPAIPPMAQTETTVPGRSNATETQGRQTASRVSPVPAARTTNHTPVLKHTAQQETTEHVAVISETTTNETSLIGADVLQHNTIDLTCLAAPLPNLLPDSSATTPAPDKVIAAGPIKPKRKSLDNRVHIGAISAVSTEQFNNLNGFSTGVNVDWNLTRKWGLRLGALYNIHSPQTEHRPVASVKTDEYATLIADDVIVVDVKTGANVSAQLSTGYYDDSLASSVLIPVSRLQRLELPVSAFWQPVRPLKIFAGVSFSRTLDTEADRDNFSGDYLLRLSDEVAKEDASRLSANRLQKWSTQAMLGFGVKAGKVIELGFSSRFPLGQQNTISYTPGTSSFVPADSEMYAYSNIRKPGRHVPLYTLHATIFF